MSSRHYPRLHACTGASAHANDGTLLPRPRTADGIERLAVFLCPVDGDGLCRCYCSARVIASDYSMESGKSAQVRRATTGEVLSETRRSNRLEKALRALALGDGTTENVEGVVEAEADAEAEAGDPPEVNFDDLGAVAAE